MKHLGWLISYCLISSQRNRNNYFIREDISCRRNLVRTEGITNTVQELDITEDIKFTATAFSCELHLSGAELSKPGI